MQFHHTQLANGLTIIGETAPSARSVAMGFFVRTGSRDETAAESGVSHFLEHMMFKGTPRRSAEEVNLDFDRIGSSPNAWTSEENTVFYASVLPEYLPRLVDILADIMRPSLRDDDFNTEKKVILEEIKKYQDQPGSVAWENARKIYYTTHPLGNSVLGTHESVSALTREQMQAYFTRRYAANNIILSVAGNFDWKELVDLAAKACSAWNTSEVGRMHRTEWKGKGGLHVLSREGVQQQYVLCLGGGPPSESPLRYAADTLALAIGDDTGSRLYWGLIDQGLADSADCGYYENDGSGIVCTSMTCEPEKTEKNLELIRGILRDVQFEGITAEELHLAKTKMASRWVRKSERPSGRMPAIASAWAYTGEYRDVDTEIANYEAVTLANVREFLDRYAIDQTTIVALGPAQKIDGIAAKAV